VVATLLGSSLCSSEMVFLEKRDEVQRHDVSKQSCVSPRTGLGRGVLQAPTRRRELVTSYGGAPYYRGYFLRMKEW